MGAVGAVDAEGLADGVWAVAAGAASASSHAAHRRLTLRRKIDGAAGGARSNMACEDRDGSFIYTIR